MKRRTKNNLKLLLLFVLVFLGAIGYYFYRTYSSMERQNTVYSSMDQPTLPVVFADIDGITMNPMNGYTEDMGNQAAQKLVTILPEKRNLSLKIIEYNNMVMSAQYEIRSLDLSRLIEKGSVEKISRDNGVAGIVLPIQNLIQKEQKYFLKITLDTGKEKIFYYTRILWTDHDYSKAMTALAMDFTEKSFDKTAARDITTYLESSTTADQSTLGHINLKSSFQQITWGDTGMKPDGNLYVTLKEFDGVMGAVEVRYRSSMTDAEGQTHSFDNEDNFIFRYDPSRMYIMDFDRKTNEIFDGTKDIGSDQRIQLGISDDGRTELMKSENNQYLVFETDKALWCLNQSENGKLINIFTYREENTEDLRANFADHDIRILSAEDNGDVNFLVYGYVNRGRNEGKSGILYYTYDASEDTVRENFFIALPDTFEEIEANLDKLVYLSQDGMLYFFYNGSVYGIDTNSNEVMTLASGLEFTEFASSEDHRYIVYQDNTAKNRYQADKLILMDLLGRTTQEITEEGKYLRVIGFIGSDLIYGATDPELTQIYSGTHDIPLSELHIVGTDLREKSAYQKPETCITNITVSGNRVHFLRLQVSGGGYSSTGEDTIICNRQAEEESIISEKDTLRMKSWYIKTDRKGKRIPKSVSPAHYSVERTSSIELNTALSDEEPRFEAYAYGNLQGVCRSLYEAFALVYDRYGYVTDENGKMLWNRADKATIVSLKNSAKKVVDILPELSEVSGLKKTENTILINANGLDLNSALYYLNKGYPLMVKQGEGNRLITGYDSFNVYLIDPSTGQQEVIGKEDAGTRFTQEGNPFFAVLPNEE